MHDFIVVSSQGYNEYSEPLPPVEVEKKGFINMTEKLITDKNGEEVLSRGNIYLDTDDTITLEDTVLIGGKNWEISHIEKSQDFTNRKMRIYLL
jgi:hypothetical protein